jgi:hypothetical protein
VTKTIYLQNYKQPAMWHKKPFPKNYLLLYPPAGGMVFFIVILIFVLLYRPLDTHASAIFGYELTMMIYTLAGAACLTVAAYILRLVPFFRKKHWTVLQEISAILIVLFVAGNGIFLTGFLLEESETRMNFATWSDAVLRSFLAGMLPMAAFTMAGYVRMLRQRPVVPANLPYESPDDLIQISSQLKKEELAFYPSQFVYASADSNYVNFYLFRNGILEKVMIRNSISSIEEQLSHLPFIMRTHRAYLVNVKMVESKKGNALGYRIRLKNASEEIPVSRNLTAKFKKLCPV